MQRSMVLMLCSLTLPYICGLLAWNQGGYHIIEDLSLVACFHMEVTV
jgi:hypothetical protein